MGQQPVVFLRQVLGLVVNPDGLNDPTIPSDAKARAKDILSGCKVKYTSNQDLNLIANTYYTQSQN